MPSACLEGYGQVLDASEDAQKSQGSNKRNLGPPEVPQKSFAIAYDRTRIGTRPPGLEPTVGCHMNALASPGRLRESYRNMVSTKTREV